MVTIIFFNCRNDGLWTIICWRQCGKKGKSRLQVGGGQGLELSSSCGCVTWAGPFLTSGPPLPSAESSCSTKPTHTTKRPVYVCKKFFPVVTCFLCRAKCTVRRTLRSLTKLGDSMGLGFLIEKCRTSYELV